MSVTMKSNIIIPEVMAASISAKLPNAIKFAPLAVNTTELMGRAGDTLSLPVYAYIGDAADVAEGAAIPVENLTQSVSAVKVKKAAKAIGVTDQAVGAGMEVLNEIETQIVKSMASKIDADVIEALGTIKANMTVTGDVTLDGISNALIKFGEELDDARVLFVTPEQAHTIRKELMPLPATSEVVVTGAIGMYIGCQVVVSGRLPVGTNFIVKVGALKIENKKGIELEVDRVALTKTTNVIADADYVAYLYDESKAVKIVKP
ncbi:MAG: hypothetical protein ACRC0G_16590 [Fusobacteriaceae bacterium]